MSVFCLKKNKHQTWQDRTINVEFMVAPAKSQLLYNKHKGLKTKFEQESYYLEREKESFLKAFKTERRLMERKKELFSKRRNDIILRRASADGRRRSSTAGRISAPPRLEQEHLTESKTDISFITEFPVRVTKSAGARTTFQESKHSQHRQTPEGTKLAPPVTPDMRTVSPCVSVRTPTPGRPYLLREKSVRFENMEIVNNTMNKEKVQLPIQDRIKNFIVSQAEFNKRGPTAVTNKSRNEYETSNRQMLARRRSSFNLNISKLENAFDEFCSDGTSQGLNKLVKYASKMKINVRNIRPPSVNFTRQGTHMVKT